MQRLTHVPANGSEKDALSMLAKELDGFPLAIRQMSAVFRNMRLSYGGFLKYYNEEGIEQLLSKLSTSPDSQGSSSFATLWALDRLSSATTALLRVICLLDPDDIPEEMLIDKSKTVSLDHYPRTRGEYYDARAELIASSLVNQNPKQENLSLHRLVQDAVRTLMSRDELISSFQAASTLVISAWKFQGLKDHHSTERFTHCERIFPSVLRLKNGLEPFIRDASDYPFDIRVAKLFNDVGWYVFERGLLDETKTFCELSLVLGQKLKSTLGAPAIECIRESYGFLGICLAETNEHTASLRHKKQWLAMLEERATEDGDVIEDYELGYAYNEIGVAYGNNDMLEEAAEAFRRSITIFQGLDDYDDTMLGWPEPNLGFIYWLQGRLDHAEQVLVEILDIYDLAYGIDDTRSFKTGKILYAIGNVLEAQKRFDESLSFHQRCFEQYKKVLSLKDHRMGDVCHKMASHCMRQGLFQEARNYFDIALNIFQSRSYLLNERCRTTFYKAMLLRKMDLVAEAVELLRDAYEMRRELKPQDRRSQDELEEADFDKLVAFWSR